MQLKSDVMAAPDQICQTLTNNLKYTVAHQIMVTCPVHVIMTFQVFQPSLNKGCLFLSYQYDLPSILKMFGMHVPG